MGEKNAINRRGEKNENKPRLNHDLKGGLRKEGFLNPEMPDW